MQSFLVGKAVRFVSQEEVMLCFPTWLEIKYSNILCKKVLRLMINGKVYYSEEYKRMTKRICYAVMFQSHVETEFSFIKCFVHRKDTDETYAVMHISEVTDSPPALRRVPLH